MPGLTPMPTAPNPAPTNLQLPPNFPGLPQDVIDRFPSLQQWQDAVNEWWNSLTNAMNEAISSNSSVTNQATQNIEVLQTDVADLQPGPYAAGSPVATGTVEIKDNQGNTHKALVE